VITVQQQADLLAVQLRGLDLGREGACLRVLPLRSVRVGVLVEHEHHPQMAVLFQALDGEGREVCGEDDLAPRGGREEALSRGPAAPWEARVHEPDRREVVPGRGVRLLVQEDREVQEGGEGGEGGGVERETQAFDRDKSSSKATSCPTWTRSLSVRSALILPCLSLTSRARSVPHSPQAQ
jgi:hypothetical protein